MRQKRRIFRWPHRRPPRTLVSNGWVTLELTIQDIIGENYSFLEQGHIHEARSTLTLPTANGPVATNIAVDTHLPGLMKGFSPYILKSSPPALSIG